MIVRFQSTFEPETTQASVVEAVSMSALKNTLFWLHSATEKNRAVYTVMAYNVTEKVHKPLFLVPVVSRPHSPAYHPSRRW